MDRNAQLNALFDDWQKVGKLWKQAFQKELGSEQIAPAQMGVLFYLNQHQPISGKKIAAQLQISASAVTQLVDGLDKLGYIRREPDPSDRRIVYLNLSFQGKQKVIMLEEKRKQFFLEITDTLTDEEIAVNKAIQEKMIQQIETKLGEL